MPTIRLASGADIDSLAAIFAAAASTIPRPAHAAPDRHATLDTAAVMARIDAGLVVLAEVEQAVAGYAALGRLGHPAVVAAHPLQLWQLYVAPQFHGTGVAVRLLSAALAHARRHEHDVIWLGVSEQNGRAIAFYRKHGFDDVGIHPVGAHDEAHRDLVMSRTVPPTRS